MTERGPSRARYRARSHVDRGVRRSGVVRPHPGLRYRQPPRSWDRVTGPHLLRGVRADARNGALRAPFHCRSVRLADAWFPPASGQLSEDLGLLRSELFLRQDPLVLEGGEFLELV